MKPLQQGDEIRVIAPSFKQSGRKDQRHSERAKERLESLGYRVTFGKYLRDEYHLGTAKPKDRLADFSDAYKDPNVKAVMAFTGGWSANELLPYIDWELIRLNPKPLIGYSDITVLLNAIYAKTGVVNYLGPNFSTLGRMTSWRYTLDNLNAVLQQQTPLSLKKSKEWGEKSSKKFKTSAWKILQPGSSQGVLLGGNLGTFYLLQGTEYQPKFDQPFILAIEDDDESGKFTAREFSRRLESILQLPDVRKNLRGMIVGRFQSASKVSAKDLASIIESKALNKVPVIAGLDFGHTTPMFTLPIGGILALDTATRLVEIQ